jgi:hypothetical protein
MDDCHFSYIKKFEKEKTLPHIEGNYFSPKQFAHKLYFITR